MCDMKCYELSLLLPFLYLFLSWSYLITSCDLIPWLDMWLCHMISSHDFHDASLHLLQHVFYMCSTCVLHVFPFVSYLSLLSFVIDMHSTCIFHMLLHNTCLPSFYHMFTLCLPSLCLKDFTIYSIVYYHCNLTSH